MTSIEQARTKMVVCVGAGISALSLIRHFAEKTPTQNISWTVLEKSKGVGGRIATRRWGENSIWNMGASEIQVEGRELQAFLKRWQTDTHESRDTFSAENMNTIPKTLWAELQTSTIQTEFKFNLFKKSLVTSIERIETTRAPRFKITFQQDVIEKSIIADWVIIHAPIPQAKGWRWRNLPFPDELNEVAYQSEEVVHPSPAENPSHVWKYANVSKAHPGFYFFKDGLGFCGDGFACGMNPSRENGIERAWISGRSLADFLIAHS